MKSISMSRLYIDASFTAFATVLAAVPATAQNMGTAPSGAGPAATATATATEGLSEIVVTANRRAENQQDVPIAVSTISGASLEARGVSSTESLQTAVPGLSAGRQAGLGGFFLRGVGSQSVAHGTESPVAIFVDDVYILGGGAALFDFTAIDHVEVLKGPQGTLFGRNATGGVIHLITRDPENRPRFDASGGYANYDTISGDLYASTPVTDALRINISAFGTDQRKGWGHNINNGEDVFLGWKWGVRSKLVWEPSGDTYVRLSADAGGQRGQMGLGLHPQPGTFIVGCVPPTAACRIGDIGFYNSADLHAATYTGGATGGVVTTPAKDITDFYLNRQQGVSLKINQNLGFARLISITSYRHFQSNFYLDQDGGPVVTSDSYIRQRDANYSQEIQLQSPSSSKISWIVGAYYLHDDAQYNPYINKGSGRGGNTLYYFGTQITKSIAGFGQVTVPIFTTTNITAGARYTQDKRGVSAFFYSLNPAGTQVSGGTLGFAAGAPPSTKWRKVTFRATLDHHFTDDVMAYASFNRGFKSGVYNLLVPPPGAAPTVSNFAKPASPEVLDAYEVGLKSEFLDHRLRFNAAAFWYDYTNLQVTSISTGITQTLNAGSARVRGLDFDVTALAADNLTLTLAASILDGKYTKFPGAPHLVPQGTPGTPLTAGRSNICTNQPFLPNSVGGNVSGVAPGNSGCDLSGNETVRTPPFTISASAAYTIPTSFGDLALNASYIHTDRFFWEFDNSVKSPPSDVVNASVGWTSPDGHYDVTIWGKNLLDEKIYSYANSSSLGQLFSPAPPLTFGIRFGTHWGG